MASKNPEVRKRANRRYREKHREKIRTYAKAHDPAYRTANREKRLACAAAYRAAHPDEVREYDKAYRAANKPAKRARKLKRKYGLTPSTFDSMLADQGGLCAICKTGDPGKRGWHVDHDHQTGLVRGILCRECNLGLGFLGDTAETVAAAAKYLEPTRAISPKRR